MNGDDDFARAHHAELRARRRFDGARVGAKVCDLSFERGVSGTQRLNLSAHLRVLSGGIVEFDARAVCYSEAQHEKRDDEETRQYV